MATPHIGAVKGQIADVVLMPGDPLRAKMIAEEWMDNAELVSGVRGMYAYSCTYRGRKITVMASGMGMPSIGIYSYELFNGYDVENIIRVGTAGAIHEDLKIRDIVIAMGACTDSNYVGQFEIPGKYAPIASYELLNKAVEEAKSREGVRYKVGNVYSHDVFYDPSGSAMQFAKMGVLAVEMEAAALYMNAAWAGKNALAICTISDHILTGEATTSAERQTAFNTMMEIALEIA